MGRHPGRRRRIQSARILPRHRHTGQHRGRSENGPGGRHRLKHFMIEPGADLGVLDIDGWRRAGHRHRFLQRRDFHGSVDGHRLPYRNDDAFADQRRKPGELELQCIRAVVDAREAVQPAGVGRDRRRAHDRRSGQRDRDAGQHRTLVVGHLANQFTEHLACLRRGRCQPEGEHDGQSGQGPKNPTCHR